MAIYEVISNTFFDLILRMCIFFYQTDNQSSILKKNSMTYIFNENYNLKKHQ